MSRPPHEYPAARATGDLAAIGKAMRYSPPPDAQCGHRWWETPLIYLAIALAMAIVLWPLCWLAVTLYDRAILGCP